MANKRSVDDILQQYLPSCELKEMNKHLYGTDHCDNRCKHLESNLNGDFDLEKYRFMGDSGASRIVRIAAIQHSIVLPTTEPILKQRKAIFDKISKMIQTAANSNVNILCLPETWNMPFGFCTRDKLPVCEFAEDIKTGPTTMFLKNLAKQYNMVIISPILERDTNHGDVLWNTAVVISERGTILGIQRKNHIPVNGESVYYTHGSNGHPVFETTFGRIAVCICFDRHHPQSWLMYALNGAEIVFNPCATTVNEHWWPIEGRNAAVANHFYTVNINRVGTEMFKNGEKILGPFFGSTYIAAPDGSRTKSLSNKRDGILYAELDLNICNNGFGFRASQRPEYYKEYYDRLADGSFNPNQNSFQQ